MFLERPFLLTFVNFRVNLFWILKQLQKHFSLFSTWLIIFLLPEICLVELHPNFLLNLAHYSIHQMRNWTINNFILLFFRASLLRAFSSYSFIRLPSIRVTLFDETVSYFPLIFFPFLTFFSMWAYEFFTIISLSMIMPTLRPMQ